MAAGELRIGLNGEFLYGAAGSTATTKHDNVHDVNLNAAAEKAEARRRHKKFISRKTTYLDCSVTFKIHDEEGDTLIPILRAHYMNKTRVALKPTDINGGDGLDADFYISKFSRDESNPAFIVYDVVADPTDEEREPTWA